MLVESGQRLPVLRSFFTVCPAELVASAMKTSEVLRKHKHCTQPVQGLYLYLAVSAGLATDEPFRLKLVHESVRMHPSFALVVLVKSREASRECPSTSPFRFC